jgi:hypothetical protein
MFYYIDVHLLAHCIQLNFHLYGSHPFVFCAKYATFADSNKTQADFCSNCAFACVLHVLVLSPSSGISIQNPYKGRYNKLSLMMA